MVDQWLHHWISCYPVVLLLPKPFAKLADDVGTPLKVDFVIDRGSSLVAIEAKATTRVTERDLRGLRALKSEFPDCHAYVVCEEPVARDTEDGIMIRPIATFLNQLWSDGTEHL